MALNNHTKEQFMTRIGSFSTHGSRRGYSDLGLPLGINDLNDPAEKKKIIFDRIVELNKIEKPDKKIRSAKHQLHALLSDINMEIKKHNIESSEEFNQRMNFGRFFMDYCRKHMPKDQYLLLAKGARDEFEKIN